MDYDMFTLNNFVLHQISKNDNGELQLTFSEAPLLSAFSESLATELHRAFHGKTVGFGRFEPDSEMNEKIKKVDIESFHSFYLSSKTMAERFVDKLSQYPFAQPGILVFALYESLATKYLYIGLLHTNHSLKVTDSLSIGATDYIDAQKVSIAIRIDLTSLKIEPENIDAARYIAFTKGRPGQRYDQFTLDFLEAQTGLQPKVQNQVLLQAVYDFCQTNFDHDDSLALERAVFKYCDQASKSGDEIKLDELSGELPSTDEGTTFDTFVESQGYELEESFPVVKTEVKKLKAFFGSGGGINISFDTCLLSERVFFDQETDTLTIKGIPPNLRDQLNRRLKSNK